MNWAYLFIIILVSFDQHTSVLYWFFLVTISSTYRFLASTTKKGKKKWSTQKKVYLPNGITVTLSIRPKQHTRTQWSRKKEKSIASRWLLEDLYWRREGERSQFSVIEEKATSLEVYCISIRNRFCCGWKNSRLTNTLNATDRSTACLTREKRLAMSI